MKKNIIFIFTCVSILIIYSNDTYAQQKTQTQHSKLHTIYYLKLNYPKPSDCKIELMKKYGFQEKHVIPSSKKKFQKFINHNKKIEEKLIIRNGQFWKLDLKKGLKKCTEEEKSNSEWDLDSD